MNSSAHLAVYCGPLPEGRIAFARGVSASRGDVTLPLTPSRSIQGRALGCPSDAIPDRVWADSSEFEATGLFNSDGSFLIHGIPSGSCRVRVVFRRGPERWTGSIKVEGTNAPATVELQRMDAAAFTAWLAERPTR